MDNEKYTLDYFRKNNVGYMLFNIKYDINHIALPFIYSDYFDTTTQSFLSYLKHLENMDNNPRCNIAELLQAFTNYFAAFEQFVSTLYEILFFYKQQSTIPSEQESLKLFRQDYNKTLQSIFKLIDPDARPEYYRTGLQNKIKELEDARNYILHGNIGRIKTEKTKLPQAPLTINFEDIMEELDIIINFINFFRYVIPHCDLMPNIRIFADNTVYYKRLDEYFYNYLHHYFIKILEKHNLSPTKEYHLLPPRVAPESSNIAKEAFVTIYYLTPEDYVNIPMNKEKTNYFSQVIDEKLSKEERERTKGKFQLPNFAV